MRTHSHFTFRCFLFSFSKTRTSSHDSGPSYVCPGCQIDLCDECSSTLDRGVEIEDSTPDQDELW